MNKKLTAPASLQHRAQAFDWLRERRRGKREKFIFPLRHQAGNKRKCERDALCFANALHARINLIVKNNHTHH
jgi:hypothetical protein